ncbi:Crp/Fnr family transcriptional regulator [Methylorubrum extorquens]|uniref:Crp/Fnr family transcriptional regulator n=1 Tax=Methylorubrum extorquens TaxID=408 RepID=UPI001EE57EA2|nr:Crp/Fnr family transcriptional regulator [Methylorubrum extorquens]MCG5249627.1 Crp/Fnr family transcriptional regulator [Methylorubrum extorquens]
MANPLVLKLEHGADLTNEDRALLQSLSGTARRIQAHQDIIREGERPENVHLIMEGWACRYKQLPDGKRQIMAFLVPGDFCDLHVAILGEMDHNIGTAWGCNLVAIPRRIIDELVQSHPRIARALWWSTLADEGTLREWLVNLGQRQADRRMAHLFCELLVRLQTVGCTDEDGFEFPISQIDLSDALGITSVHVSRVLKELQAQSLVTWQNGRLRILDAPKLKAFSGFNDRYLHLTRRRNGGAPSETASFG